MSQLIPEIRYLKELLEALSGVPDNQKKRGATRIVSELYGKISGINNLFEAQVSLLKTIESLPDTIRDQFPQAGRQAAALALVDRIRGIFGPHNMSQPFDQFFGGSEADRNFTISSVVLLDDLTFDSAALGGAFPEIINEIGNLRNKVAAQDGLSHSTIVLVDAQLSLIEKSILRFNQSGVSAFRDVVFTSIGKIYIELKTNPGNERAPVRETLDDVIRVYDLLLIGGNLLTLAAPAAVKLLTSH